MVIRLTPEIEMALAHEAQRQGIAPEQLALESLGKLFLAPTMAESNAPATTLLDFLSGYVGTVEGTGEALSENCGQRFSEGMAAKHEQGCL
jgi:hypothetical protein